MAITLCLVVAIWCLFVLAGAWSHYWYCATYHGYRPLAFSPEAWAAADPDTRGHMLNDFLAKHRLEGKTADEVEALLGPPDAGSKNGLAYRVGYRGFNPRVPIVFSYTLHIRLNDEGRVASFSVDD